MQIKFDDVTFFYNTKTIDQQLVLKNVSFNLENDNFIAIVGKTGSGKTTIIDLIFAFLKPSFGSIKIDDFVNFAEKKNSQKVLYNFRKKIGILFQFTESQLFKDTVIEDVIFGVKNFFPKENAKKKAIEVLKMVGLDDSFYNRSPFDLSAGEKKLVAIAGILSCNPKLLILDEITTGLDADKKKSIMDLIKKIQKINNIKVILITHDMEVVLKYADKMMLLYDNKIIKEGKPCDILQEEDIEEFGIMMPNIFKFINLLRNSGYKIKKNISNIDELAKEIKKNE